MMRFIKRVQRSNTSSLDAYLNRVFKIILVMTPAAALMASATFTIFKIVGWYSYVPWSALIAFDVFDICATLVSAWFFRTCMTDDGMIITKKLIRGKMYLACLIVAQWNFISYMVPAKEFWAFAPFFICLAVFFFDMRMTAFVSLGIFVSTIISWVVTPHTMFLESNGLFYPNLVLRLIALILSIAALMVLTYFGGRFLVEELEKYANYDTLTRLLNRRTMDSYLQKAYREAKTGKSPFCLLMCDIDNFKEVNDTYGHDCGDRVLQYIAQTISTGVKRNDNVFRWGGEEIMVLLSVDKDVAESVAERIRGEIERGSVDYRGEAKINVTITIGVAPYVNGATIQSMMDDADAKLYWGKRHGKNQVVCQLPESLQH